VIRRNRAVAALAATAAVMAAVTTVPKAHASTPAPPAFGQPTISGIQADGFEQDIELDNTTSNEIIYTSGPIATGSVATIWRSLDGGQTFKLIPAQIPPSGKPLGTCIGGGDTELGVDKAGHLFFNDLWLGNFSTARSDDHGKTFAVGASCAAVPDAAVDRQWYTEVGDPTTAAANTGLFLAYDRLDQSVPACQSTPIGNALVMARSPAFQQPGSTAGETFSASLPLSCDEAIMGNDVSFTYPGTGAASGPKVFDIHDNAAINKILVNRCDVVAESATNPTGLANCLTDAQGLVASFPGFVTGANFPTISVDNQGGLFAVWEEAPGAGRGNNITGNTYLYFSTSSNEGTSWSAPKQLPTPGLNQNVFAWPASGDPGRIDVAFYGAPEAWQAHDPNNGNGPDNLGPDSVAGHYGLYMVQTLDGGTTWSAPILASEHHIHYGTQYTLIGGQSGNRALGDFLRIRVGPNGEAEISYADSNNFESGSDLSPQGMYVRQISGTGLFANKTINGPLPPSGGCVNDPQSGDATLDANGTSSANIAHLELLRACMSQPDANNYKITMKVSDLTTPAGMSGPGPDPTAGGTTNVWQTQWHVPSSTDPQGGALFFAYMESVNGATPTCWVGQSSQFVLPSGAELTYPGTTQLTGSNCVYTPTAPGTITITVPVADVTEPGAIGNTLYSVTASTQTVNGPAEDPPATDTQANGIVAGQPPNLIDVAPGFDLVGLSSNIPEVPWAQLLLLVGVGMASAAALVRRRRASSA